MLKQAHVMASVTLHLPDALIWKDSSGQEKLRQRSQFLLALKFFELGELTSGQAAEMAEMSRVRFLEEASRLGIPVVDYDEDELTREIGLAHDPQLAG